MPGNGTLITATDGQDNCSLYVSNNDGSSYYVSGREYNAVNKTGAALSEGEVVEVEWSVKKGELQVTATATKAVGSIDAAGGTFTVADGGNTSLSGSVSISSTHGDNEGWGGASNVYCGNVDGEAAYLCE